LVHKAIVLQTQARRLGLLRGWWGEERRKRMAVRQAADSCFERFKNADVGKVGAG
jgi:hypothetical protein